MIRAIYSLQYYSEAKLHSKYIIYYSIRFGKYNKNLIQSILYAILNSEETTNINMRQ